jgi:hypothetical protein
MIRFSRAHVWIRTAALLAALIGLPAAPALQPAPAQEIDGLIADLESPSYRVREKASARLLVLEARAVEPLQRAVASGKSLELVARAQQLLRKLVIFEPGGATVNGLKLILKGDRDKVKLGDTLTLTTWLCNMTHADMNVTVALYGSPHAFTAGAGLRRLVPAADGKAPPTEEAARTVRGGMINRLHALHRTVPARTAVPYRTTATLLRQNGDTYYYLSEGMPANLAAPAEGEHTLRMVLVAAAPDPVGRPASKDIRSVPDLAPVNQSAPFWGGTVRSNDVRLRVLP